MKEDTIILNKSYAFSLRIVKLYFHLVERNREYVLSKQIIGIETSIGANVEEAVEGKSRRDFKSKMNTAYQEARESSY